MFVHKNASYSNYIFRLDKSLFYSKKGSTVKYDLAIFDTEIKSISAIGNMLLILTEGGLYYAIYSDDTYTLLGNKLPELPDIEFKYVQEQELRTTNPTIISKDINATDIYVGSRPGQDFEMNDNNKYKVTVNGAEASVKMREMGMFEITVDAECKNFEVDIQLV